MKTHHHESSRTGPRATPAQVVALGLIAASIGWGVWLLRDRPISEEVELLPGTVLPSSELAIVEAAFDRAQLVGHRTEDGRVWVPRPRQSAYMRALVDAEALPREFGSSLRRALEKNSPWQSRAVQEELLRVAVQEELAHVICSMPGIERAAVLYDVDERPAFDGGLSGGPTRTASVNIRTQPDIELEPARVLAIRVLVASSIAGLTPERVAVTDLRSGRVHAGPLEPATAADDVAIDSALARRIAHERHLAAKVRQGLSFVKGAVVDVTVTFAAPAPTAPPPAVAAPEPVLPKRRQPVAAANSPAEIAVADEAAPVAVPPPAVAVPPVHDGPETIRVSLAVPETYFEAATRSGDTRGQGGVEMRRVAEQRLRDHVLHLLPPTPHPDGRDVAITTFAVTGSRGSPRTPVAMTTLPASRGGVEPSATPVPPESPAARGPRTVGEHVDAAWRALAEGRPGDVPREAWLAAGAMAALLLTWLVFRGSTAADERRPARPRRRNSPRIDWSTLDGAGGDEFGDEGTVGERPSTRQVAA
jgi:type III secretory pathway lipoprotein EscJ